MLVGLALSAYAQQAQQIQHFVDRPTTIPERLMSFVGIFAFAGMCWLMSENRDKIKWRPVIWGIVLQVLLCSILVIPYASEALSFVGDAVKTLLDFAGEGAKFVFGSFFMHDMVVWGQPHTYGVADPHSGLNEISAPLQNFAFVVLPTIIFFSAFSNALYYFGVLQLVVKGISYIMRLTLGTSGAETLCTAANVFLGQTEAPLLVRPFIETMTRSELMAVMVGGFSTIAIGVLGLYASWLSAIPNAAGHLLVASLISAPATFACCKLVVPETETPKTGGDGAIELPKSEGNLLLTIAAGASDGMKLALNVAALLIAIVALVKLVDTGISYIPFTQCAGAWSTGYTCAAGVEPQPLDLAHILGWIFMPFAILMGVHWEDASTVGSLLGQKLVLTELVAYSNMRVLLESGNPAMSERSAIIAAYALCGFANFASVGIQIGGIGGLAPNRTKDLADLGMKAMFVGCIATCMTGAVVGLFV